MNCKIEYVGKKRNGVAQYYCITHKSFASDKKGNKLDECFCENKKQFEKVTDLNGRRVKSLKIVIDNILESGIPEVFLDGELYDGVFQYGDSILTYKDLVGVMLVKLNGIKVKIIECNRCHKGHSDNGKFAYTPHSTHFCQYCGHLFRVKRKNIGSEFTSILSIPDIELSKKIVCVEDNCRLEYDLLDGVLLINGEKANEILLKNAKIPVVDFLNKIFADEY